MKNGSEMEVSAVAAPSKKELSSQEIPEHLQHMVPLGASPPKDMSRKGWIATMEQQWQTQQEQQEQLAQWLTQVTGTGVSVIAPQGQPIFLEPTYTLPNIIDLTELNTVERIILSRDRAQIRKLKAMVRQEALIETHEAYDHAVMNVDFVSDEMRTQSTEMLIRLYSFYMNNTFDAIYECREGKRQNPEYKHIKRNSELFLHTVTSIEHLKERGAHFTEIEPVYYINTLFYQWRFYQMLKDFPHLVKKGMVGSDIKPQKRVPFFSEKMEEIDGRIEQLKEQYKDTSEIQSYITFRRAEICIEEGRYGKAEEKYRLLAEAYEPNRKISDLHGLTYIKAYILANNTMVSQIFNGSKVAPVNIKAQMKRYEDGVERACELIKEYYGLHPTNDLLGDTLRKFHQHMIDYINLVVNNQTDFKFLGLAQEERLEKSIKLCSQIKEIFKDDHTKEQHFGNAEAEWLRITGALDKKIDPARKLLEVLKQRKVNEEQEAATGALVKQSELAAQEEVAHQHAADLMVLEQESKKIESARKEKKEQRKTALKVVTREPKEKKGGSNQLKEPPESKATELLREAMELNLSWLGYEEGIGYTDVNNLYDNAFRNKDADAVIKCQALYQQAEVLREQVLADIEESCNSERELAGGAKLALLESTKSLFSQSKELLKEATGQLKRISPEAKKAHCKNAIKMVDEDSQEYIDQKSALIKKAEPQLKKLEKGREKKKQQAGSQWQDNPGVSRHHTGKLMGISAKATEHKSLSKVLRGKDAFALLAELQGAPDKAVSNSEVLGSECASEGRLAQRA